MPYFINLLLNNKIKIIYTAGAPKAPYASLAQGVAKANLSRFLRGERGKPWVTYDLVYMQIDDDERIGASAICE